ncbi:RNA-binding motif protein [Cladobotryum mycophilum]|uniref:RNA-binding motif protein n=1 Tax=Cladobotryum mycophilum TaxID=491253 RepID=A0ABR0SHL3_9HYPO
MNQIRAIQALNKKEIENGISPDASWHVDYRDTAFIYFGGLPYELSEGDIVTIFSQFGEPVFLKLVRDKETGKSKGFGWLKYENQRSTDLAVDNLGGAEISGRLVRVDHARYKARDDEDQDEFKIGWEDVRRREGQPESEDESSEEEVARPMLPEERELALLIQNHDDDDPMKGFLIEEKKKRSRKLGRERRRRRRNTSIGNIDTGQGEMTEMRTGTNHQEGMRRQQRGSTGTSQEGIETVMVRGTAIEGTGMEMMINQETLKEDGKGEMSMVKIESGQDGGTMTAQRRINTGGRETTMIVARENRDTRVEAGRPGVMKISIMANC